MPTLKKPVVLIDAGANTDCEPRLLAQFAAMGSMYAHIILERENPTVGLLSIGGEESKGNELTKEAHGILQASHLNFHGNVESNDLFQGEVDVVVCDGFAGNLVLKTSESAGRAIGHWMKEEFGRSPLRVLGAMLLRGAFRAMKQKIDPEQTGGALLLGVNGVCIIGHGSSSSSAIYHSLRVASDMCRHRLNEFIIDEVAKLP